MARTNDVWLLGWVESIDIRPDCRSGGMILHTIRRQSCDRYLRQEGKERWDEPIVFTEDPKIIKDKMKDLHKGDIVFVKGVYVTRDTSRRYFCGTCRSYRTVEGCVSVYIRPLDILTAAEGMTDAEEEALSPEEKEALSGRVMLPFQSYAFLRRHQESGNLILIAGTVCTEPDPTADYYERGDAYRTFVFKIASNRIFRVPEDPVGKSTDYPVVRCYGKTAEDALRTLHMGTDVLINGAVQTRRIRRTAVCPVCGELMERNGIAMEIVPRDVTVLGDSRKEAEECHPETGEAILLGRAVRVEERETADAGSSGKCGFILQTVRRAALCAGIRNRNAEIWDLPYVYSDDPVISGDMASVRTGDLVLVRAVVSAGSRKIRIRCPSCGREIPDIRRNSIYLSPLDIVRVSGGRSSPEEENPDEKTDSEIRLSVPEIIRRIRSHREISNQAVIVGRVVREPKDEDLVRRKDRRDTEFSFDAAHDRMYRTGKEGRDILRVRCFGRMAEEAFGSIHENSLVLINGAVQAGWGWNHARCPLCREEVRWRDTLTELVPYHVEYLRDCDLPGKEA